MKNRFSISDIALLLGIILIGVGIYFCGGIGIALTIDGAIILALGILWNVGESRAKK